MHTNAISCLRASLYSSLIACRNASAHAESLSGVLDHERADFTVQLMHLKKFLEDADVHDKKLRVG